MKRFFSFLVLAVLFTGCDDGDLQEVSFEFDESAALHCNENVNSDKFFIYKTTDKRALILELAENNFTTTITSDTVAQNIVNGQIKLVLNNDNKLTYRVYNDDITNTTICSTFPPAYPVVTEERVASSGEIYIKTTALKSEPKADGSTEITSYLHTINFSDITFNVPGGSQRNESLPAITYTKLATPFNDFSTSFPIVNCAGDMRFLFKITNSQSLELRLSDADAAYLFSNDITAPKTRLINSENTLTHKFFSKTATTPLTEAYLCSAQTPAFPTLKETWKAADGVEGVSGIIEVITSETLDGYKHLVTFRNVKMTRGSQNFLLKSEFVFGEIEIDVP